MFLDLGDTLMHIHPDVPSLYLAAARELGLDVTAADVDSALRVGERLYRDALRSGREFESSTADAQAFWHEYHEHILAALRVHDGARRERLAGALTERFWHPSAWRPFDEVLEVLAALHAAGLTLAVVSNFTDALHALCLEHDLVRHLDTVVASVHVGAQKPDVAIFREALRRTGGDPAASLMVGDNYVADVLGARAAGIDGVLVDRSRRGGRGMFDFALRDGIGGTAGVRLDCPVIADLRELLVLTG